mgnify:CR=1 FL=1
MGANQLKLENLDSKVNITIAELTSPLAQRFQALQVILSSCPLKKVPMS